MAKEDVFDVRILNRQLAAGRVTQQELDQYLGELEDCSEEAEKTTTQMVQPPDPEEDEETKS